MIPSNHSGRPLPGWGHALRHWPGRTSRTAVMLAAFAGLSLNACTPGPVAPLATDAAQVGINSQPARMRAALTLALRHLDYLPLPASHPFYLVAFKGRALDENGATTAANGSDWEFVFTRYAEAMASQRYEYASIVVPGIGVTRLSRGVSEDAAMSPIENWDAAEDGSSPDSFDMLTPFKAKGLPAGGATIVLSRGLVTIQAGGKSTTFNTLEGSYTPVK